VGGGKGGGHSQNGQCTTRTVNGGTLLTASLSTKGEHSETCGFCFIVPCTGSPRQTWILRECVQLGTDKLSSASHRKR